MTATLIADLATARLAADRLCARARGQTGPEQQHALHSLAWLATTVETLRQLEAYARRMAAAGRLGELEQLLVRIAAGECLNQIRGGIPMNQAEFARFPAQDFDPGPLISTGNTAQTRAAAMALMAQDPAALHFGDPGDDDTVAEMRRSMRRYTLEQVTPHAHAWHLANAYVPLPVIAELAELGVFALTLPEAHGGLGLGKEAMCVVSEELSRGWIAVGSLGTRAEIACELILIGGTAAQQAKWLPRIAAGEVLPTAVFTEPDTGSDLGALGTRAVQRGDQYRITGNKTWITHPVRADLMTLLARTSAEPGWRGLSMFLAEKPRGSDAEPFPATGMSGSEIAVLGYRGMKEYEIRFEDFAVAADSLLGGVEGQGFKQLMQTFESARIQTAARAIGVAQNALELGLAYALNRRQFGKPIAAFPRVADKLVLMAADILACRQLTYHAAREKDAGRRCDVEAGMAKLLAARAAWAAADNAVQIHGGNGFALEYPISRVLCDARILNIFEGAAEIQAEVIGKRLLSGKN